MTRVPAVVLAALVLSGCSGPGAQVDYAVKGVRTDVRLGSRETPRTAPLRKHTTETPGFPSPGFLPPPPPPLPPAATPSALPTPSPSATPACRKATPLDFPKQEAAQTVSALPLAGQYAFRDSGTIGTVPFQREVRRRVTHTPPDPSALPSADGVTRYDYDVSEALPDGGSYRTYYQVVTGTAQGAGDGIYLYETEYVPRAGTTPEAFTPVPAIRLVALPMNGDLTSQGWRSVGSDAVSGLTMTVDGKVGQRERVDACGTVIDAFRVELTCSVVGTGKSETFTVVHHVAPQLGGLFVASKVDMTGTHDGTPVEQHVTSVVSADHPVAP